MKIESEYNSGVLYLHFIGELDHHAAGETVRSCESSIDEFLPRSCEADFSKVTFMDSSGIAVLLKARRRLSDYGGSLCVTHAGNRICRVLNAAGIGKLISINPNNIGQKNVGEVHMA